jgi:hypothetical protein
LVAFGAAPAQAARVHPLELSETLPNQGRSISVAVNQPTQDFYAATFGTSGRAVYHFKADGQIDSANPELIGGPTFEPQFVTVDNSGTATQGYLYAVDFGPGGPAVQQFLPSGTATAVKIDQASVPPNGTPQAGGLPPVVNKGEFGPFALAVDTSGEVFIFDVDAEAIDVFTPAGGFVKQIAAGIISGFPGAIAIDSADDIYVAVQAGSNPGLYELDASGQCVQVACAPIATEAVQGVAVDNAAGVVFTTGLLSTGTEPRGRFSEYEASTGKLLGVTQPAALHAPFGIAVNEATGQVIVADSRPEQEATVKIFGGVEVVPDVETLTPENVTDEGATLKGKIGAAGIAGATCVFQYVDAEEFAAHGFEGTPTEPAPTAPCQPAGPFSGEAMNAVHADLVGLPGGTTYHERILGTNANGSNPGKDVPFTTLGPTIAGTEAAEVGQNTATLKGTVDPNGSATTYRFEYLTEAAYKANPPADRWAGAVEVPAGGASIGAGVNAVPVSQAIGGLVPRTAYRMRIVAISGEGTSEGTEIVFLTQASPSPGLADGRRYEQVSPMAKNGTNIQGAIDGVQAAGSGERITFFSNAGIPGGEGAQQFPTFMASRSSAGWSTEGLLPPASDGPRAEVLGWDEELSNTYDFASQPFVGGKVLLRTGPGSLAQVGAIASQINPFAYAGSSEGGALALLESGAGGMLPNDLTGKQNVYAYGRDTGQLVVAGVLNPTTPGGEPTVPPGGAMAGSYDWFNSHSTTEKRGGALGNYYTQAGHAISADGTKIFFTAGGTGQIYVRLNPLAPQSAMSGGSCTEAAKACTVRLSAPEAPVTDPGTPAAFVGASADGSLVYFFDKGKLTANATGGSGYDLYRYDVATGELLDLSLDTIDKNGARVEGMLAIGGPQGEDAYFVAAGQLASGTTQAPSGETNLYALHGTTITFVARLGTSGGVHAEQDDWVPTSRLAEGNPTAHASRLSADGQTLLFRSARRLTSYDNHGIAELYLDRGATISCISCNPTGEAPAGPAGVQEIPGNGFSAVRTYAILTRNLSVDGKRVLFDTADRLVSADHNDVNDVYEWEAPDPADPTDSCTTGSSAYVTSSGGCLFLISGGAEGVGASYFADADPSGRNAFFFTAQPLVAQDKDELVDVYDARVGGGIASQESVPAPPCEGEAGCRGPGSVQPVAPTPGSSSFTGPGNPQPKKPCPKGRVRKGGRCVAKHKSRHKKKSSDNKQKGKSHQAQGKGGGR